MIDRIHIPQKCAAVFTGITGLIALLILAGWQFDIGILIRPIPAAISMNPVTAICFIAATLSLWLLLQKEKSKPALYIIRTLSFLIAITALIKLYSILFNNTISIDTWLFSKKLLIDKERSPVKNHMCANTAANLFLLSTALFTSTYKKRSVAIAANYVAFFVVAIGTFSILGYVFNVKEFYGLYSHISTPLYSAICFALSGMAILFYKSDIGFMQTFTSASSGGAMARLLIPTVILVPVTLGYLRLKLYWEHPFSVELGVASLITCIIIIFYVVIWRFAAILNKTDEAKKLAEQKLLELNRQLEQKIEERTKEAMAHETKFQAVVENSFDMILLLTADLKYIFRNKNSELITGWTAAEVEQIGHFNIVHPDDKARAMESVNKTLQHPDQPISVSFRVLHKRGHCIWLNGTFTNYLNNPNIKAIVGTLCDITEKKATDDQLRKSEMGLKEAQAIACMGNWEINLETQEASWSDGMNAVYGIQQGERQPSLEAFMSFIHPDDILYVQETIASTFSSLHNSSFSFRFIRKDAVTRHGYSQWKFDLDATGKPVRIYGIIQDITERKKAEEERLQMIDDLIQRNKDHEQFAYIVSHNLRAPVANILGFAEALVRPDLNNETRAKFKAGLLTSSKKLDMIIKDLANILQVQHNVNETKQLLNFSKLVEDVRISLSNIIENDKVELRCNFNINEITSIKSYMHSIFYNLISNSIKYHRPGITPVIEIESRQSANKIELLFRDNGMGIDLNTRRDQVFGLYKRFHPHIEGKGVGLFITKTQVEAMGGRITINSEVNKGAEFKMEFAL